MRHRKEPGPEIKTALVVGTANIMMLPLVDAVSEKSSPQFAFMAWFALNALLFKTLSDKGKTITGSIEEGAKGVMNKFSDFVGEPRQFPDNTVNSFFKRVANGGKEVFNNVVSLFVNTPRS